MSDSEVRYNLLKPSCFMPSLANSSNKTHTMYALGADGWVRGAGYDSRGWGAKSAEWAVELPAGAYVLLYEVDGKQGAVDDDLHVYVGDVGVEDSVGHHDGPYVHALALKLGAASIVRIMAKCYAPARYRLMLVEGTEPAAWAPAEGEELSGVGSLMSANLWDASTANIKPDADGTYTMGKSGTSPELQSKTPGMAVLAENQTVHMGASLRGAGSGSCQPYVEYADAAGNKNWVGFPIWTPTADWQRFEGSCVVPSGMHVTALGFNDSRTTGDIEIANPSFSYGSPVTLASDAHTPYATQDHVAAEYATKVDVSALSDAIAELSQLVSDLTSKEA